MTSPTVPPRASAGREVTVPVANDPMEQVLASQTLRRALPRISRDHRDVILELYYRGRTVAEVAARLGIPQTTVKSRAYHALRALHTAIATRHGEKA